MKRVILTVVFSIFIFLLSSSILIACSTGRTDVNGNTASESSGSVPDESISRSAEESVEKETVSYSDVNKSAEKETAPVNYSPTDEEKELICGDWYRSKADGKGDMDIYWLTMDERGYCTFARETMNTKGYIERLEGKWSVDDHGFVNIDLGKYKGKFRFLKNAYGSTNIICNEGDDFVESGEEGAYAAFVPVKWYRGMLRFVDNEADGTAEDSSADEADCPVEGASANDTDGTAGDDPTGEATASDAAPTDQKVHDMIYVELQGEGGKWFRLAGITDYCKVDVDTRDEEILCRLALGQNDHLILKIEQIRR